MSRRSVSLVCEMPNLVDSSALPSNIRAQLVEIERRIADLIAVRQGLLRMSLWVGNDNMEGPKRIGSNSYNRLLIEREIVDALNAAEGISLPTRDLFNRARAANPTLKYSTFRSHLTRLKDRGIIDSETRAHGCWKLPGPSIGVLRPMARAL